MVAVAVTDSGRPLARVGGLTKEQIKGEDGLRWHRLAAESGAGGTPAATAGRMPALHALAALAVHPSEKKYCLLCRESFFCLDSLRFAGRPIGRPYMCCHGFTISGTRAAGGVLRLR